MAKIGFDPIGYGTAVMEQWQVATAAAQMNIFHVSNVILMALFVQQELPNGNGRRAMEWWKPGIMVLK